MRYHLRPLHEQVMVITGASSGIGLDTAKMAAAAGAKVVLVARDEAALANAVAEIEQAGGVAAFAVADVGVPEEVEAAAALAIARFGRIDTWVNDAGVAIYAMLRDTPIAEHEQLFRTNYFGVVNGATAALRHMRASGGALITVGSIASDLPSPVMAAYAASKHAVKGYINSLRIELVTEQVPVSVTLVKPGGIDTPIGQHAANHMGHEALIPPPVYDPDLVAQAILEGAEHPRREITIGGVPRLQVLIGTHFPGLLDHLARFLIPALTDPSRPPTPSDNMSAPANEGRVRSGIKSGRSFSLYTWAARHRVVTGLGLAALAGTAMTLAARRSSQ
ncbi:SDR family oxidoreductase [Sphingomonas crusticola]|uniref:SDR family oxidoreductase n=1 Tax=Sphingomonas crusticola TaxID=1697973 RepID=UPI000E24E5E0|nr:SDR family oxidoreductase [Sphingomonas crusticola]